MNRRPDLDVGRWLAVEEEDDPGPNKMIKIVWRLRGRGTDEITATWAGVLVVLDCTYLDEVETVFVKARGVSADLLARHMMEEPEL